MKFILYITLFCLACVANYSCNRTNTFASFEQLTKYISIPENGLAKEKTVGDITFKLKYLPPDYLIYNQLDLTQTVNRQMIDSLGKRYKSSVTFLLSIGPDERGNFDITKYGINNYEQFAKQLEQLCFSTRDWIIIRDDKGNEFKPSIVHMENINALEKYRNVIVVFDTGNYLADNFSFIFSDELFNTGINKFYFKASDINGIPKIILKT